MKNPPAVTFRVHGKIITVHPREIAVNALRDEEEADKILQWLQREINEAWEKREEIKPSYKGAAKPRVLEILKCLPRTNCRDCGQPTCMVFSTLLSQGVKAPEDCPALIEENRVKLQAYLSQYQLDP